MIGGEPRGRDDGLYAVRIHPNPARGRFNILESRVRTLMMIWPMLTRATVPLGLPQAPRIPVCSLSAPAHDNILLMRTTWKGWARTRRWKPSLPECLTRYLLAQIRAASRASELSCSYSLETRWMQRGKSSTLARLRPRSKMRILGSGTPRLNRDLGNGCRKTWSADRVCDFAEVCLLLCSSSRSSRQRRNFTEP